MFFKTKDLMTVGNISLGLAGVLVAMEGMGVSTREEAGTYVFWSGLLIIMAVVFDMFDGVVARALGQMNQFGAEFDNVADLTSYSIAPAFLLYLAYQKYAILPGVEFDTTLRTIIAVTVAMFPAVFGCIRFARFNVRKLDVPGFWIGFPRPMAALFYVSLVNSHLYLGSGVMGWIGVVLIVYASFMNLSLMPFIGHHDRKWSWHLGIILTFVWLTTLVAFVAGVIFKVMPERTVFDVVLLWLSYDLFIQWTDIPKAAREEVARLTADWNE
ncbi:MAG: CDP-alcohol phosphatidyltransferase family protein [Deltaproteobacteria bacterium]|nr:CDP-alcohol phosphatidyltransferase family protein [Deltaproteobacteria bacterium]